MPAECSESAPAYPEADAKGFAVLAALDAGKSQRVIRAEVKTSGPFIRKCAADDALRARFDEWKRQVEEAERRKVADAVSATVLETGNISEAAERHGVSRVTVYKYLEVSGVVARVRELNALQAELAQYAASVAALEAIPAAVTLLTDLEIKSGTGKAALLEVLRKMAAGAAGGGGGGTSLNVAVSGTGPAVIGGQVAVATLPPPPHEQDLPPAKAAAIARAILEADAMPTLDVEQMKGADPCET